MNAKIIFLFLITFLLTPTFSVAEEYPNCIYCSYSLSVSGTVYSEGGYAISQARVGSSYYYDSTTTSASGFYSLNFSSSEEVCENPPFYPSCYGGISVPDLCASKAGFEDSCYSVDYSQTVDFALKRRNIPFSGLVRSLTLLPIFGANFTIESPSRGLIADITTGVDGRYSGTLTDFNPFGEYVTVCVTHPLYHYNCVERLMTDITPSLVQDFLMQPSTATNFTYSLWSPVFSDAGGWASQDSYWKTIQYGDLNGDGKKDICGRGSVGMYCQLSSGNGFSPLSIWSYFVSDGLGWGSNQAYWATITLTDVNGDGKADLCGRASSGIACQLSNGSSFGAPAMWTQFFGDNGGWALLPEYWQTIRFTDVNGDGKSDVCGRGHYGVYCALSTGTSFAAATQWTTAFANAGGWATAPAYWATLKFTDINGDGKADICGRASSGILCGLSTGSAFGGITVWSSYFGNAGGWAYSDAYWSTIQYGDLNNDGKDDVCGRSSAGLVCQLSSGSTFGSATLWTTGFADAGGWNVPAHFSSITLVDVTGDRKKDVCGRAADGIYCFVSTGVNFQDTLYSEFFGNNTGWSAAPSKWGTLRFTDVTGDGKADICGRASDGINCATAR
jgi:hypothetical protein